MYSVSQSTSGRDTLSQRMVMLDAVWHHPGSPMSDGFGGAALATALEAVSTALEAAATVLEAARFASDFAGGNESKVDDVGDVGAGDAVDVRELFLTGEGSDTGKSPCGCWRVETMVTIQRKQIERMEEKQ